MIKNNSKIMVTKKKRTEGGVSRRGDMEDAITELNAEQSDL
jgi:hypothetical protein